MPGLFVVFEGLDGAGKSTQASLLQEGLEKAGHVVVSTREPGGTPIGDAIRDIMLGPDHRPLLPVTQAFLMNAARAELVAQVIRPALERGRVVVSDRYWYSTLAYQSAGDGVSTETVKTLSEKATDGLEPDIVFFLDLKAMDGLGRKGEPDKNPLDRRRLDFYERARLAYQDLAWNASDRWVTLDAGLPREELARHVLGRSLQTIEERRTTPVKL